LLGQADFSIERNKLVFAEVKHGTFIVSVRGNGVLEPDHIQWLSAGVDAKVEKLAVKAGNFVKAGDLLVELSNPQLLQQLAETRWELEAREAEAIASNVAQEEALLAQKAKVLGAKLDYENSLLKYNAQTELLTKTTGTVSKLAYEQTRQTTEQLRQRWTISTQQRSKMEENLVAQGNARIARLNKTRRSLESIQQKVDNLQVRASIDSVVLDLPVELGQRIAMGASIAKLAEHNSLIAALKVPELQIRDVRKGQTVVIDTRNNKMQGIVARVDPAVVNGNVQVDVAFSGPLPPDARADLSVEGEIIVAEIENTLYVDRPIFAQSESQSPVYKLTDNEQFAQRVMVNTGYGSSSEIQIMQGLSAGDKVVTSDPSLWDKHQKIRIN